MRDRVIIIFSFLYIILLTVVWQPLVRLFIIDYPHVEITCKFLNDNMWILPACLLPFLLARLLVRHLQEKGARTFVYVLALMLTLFALLDLKLYFKIFIVFIVFYLLAILLSKKWTLKRILYLFILLMIVTHYRSQLLPKISAKNNIDFKVASFNLNSRQRKNPELMAVKLALENDFDVFFFQELPNKSPQFIADQLADTYPYQLLCDECSPYYSVMIVSKIPFSSQMNYVVEYNKESSFEINHAVMSFNGQNINLLNCHVCNPVGSLRVNDSKIEIKSSHDNQYEKHEKEGQLLLSFIRQLQGPVVLGVDLNDTPNSKLYHFLQRHLQDCYAKAGWGLGTTYGYWIFKALTPDWMRDMYFYPVRIDYIFCSPDFRVQHTEVLKVKSSEHLPVTASLILNTR